MLGRAAYDSPFIFSDFDRIFFGKENQDFSRREIIQVKQQINH